MRADGKVKADSKLFQLLEGGICKTNLEMVACLAGQEALMKTRGFRFFWLDLLLGESWIDFCFVPTQLA